MAITRIFLLNILLVFTSFLHAQTTYPKITGYTSIMHPIVTFSSDGTTTNFSDHYTVVFPTGINIWKSPKFGFSFELAPTITAQGGQSKMSNLLFHPGVLIALGKGFTFAERAAFETSGRYGVTSIFSKTVIKSKSCSYYIAVPLPLRFGNEKPTSFTIGFQVGIAF